MVYKEFKGKKLSALGFGAMRLPLTGEGDGNVDEAQVFDMVKEAFDGGINYFDTAWGYHDGKSEVIMGNALKQLDRDKFYLATKFPGYDLGNMGKAEEIFAKQLERLQVDYFDFYLVHNVCELNIDSYLDDKYADVDYLVKMKEEGKIRTLGFSAHGSIPVIKRFLDKYGKYMEFCQLQINYIDWDFQDAKGKYDLLAEHGLAVWVMEPLRGGRLVNLRENEVAALEKILPGMSPVEAGFRFIQSLPNVVMTLSGMSSMEQLKDNIAIYGEDKPFTGEQMEKVLEMAKGMVNDKTVPCTACRYCTSHCPQELNIPRMLELYNEHNFAGGGFMAAFGLKALGEENQPSDCIGCGSCAAVCPQQIDIPNVLAEFAEMMK